MSLSFSCCQSFDISTCRLHCPRCACCQDSHRHRNEVLFTDTTRRVVILSTPSIDFTSLVVFSDLDTSSLHTVVRDGDAIRYLAVHGRGFCPEGTDQLVGKKLEETMPEETLAFIRPVCEQALSGKFLQLTVMLGGGTFLCRAFPLFNHRREVVGATLVINPYNSVFHQDVNRFILDAPRAGGTRNTTPHPSTVPEAAAAELAGPPVQSMEGNTLHRPTHSGVLPSGIVPVVHG